MHKECVEWEKDNSGGLQIWHEAKQQEKVQCFSADHTVMGITAIAAPLARLSFLLEAPTKSWPVMFTLAQLSSHSKYLSLHKFPVQQCLTFS